jgi:inorganic phosphate transporter, PiT family
MPPLSFPFLLLLLASLLFAYLDGISDSANVVAPVISVRALSARRALVITTIAVTVAPFIFGVAVARTFGAGIISPQGVTPAVVLAATLGAILWRLITWWLGIPSSSSHAITGGLVGAGLAGAGLGAVNLFGLMRVLIALFASPAVGLLVGYELTRLLYFLAQWATPRINNTFRMGQVVAALALALSWGANDAQKTIGLLALGVAAASREPFAITPWIIAAAMAGIALGTLTGGWRIIRTLGGKLYLLRPIHGFAAQTAATGVIFGAALLGAPVSTTQVVSTSILGAGAAERVSKVHWAIAGEIVWAWVLTIPATALAGAGLFYVCKWLL